MQEAAALELLALVRLPVGVDNTLVAVALKVEPVKVLGKLGLMKWNSANQVDTPWLGSTVSQ